jgi:vacuolar protein sorting-associated protein 1
MLLISYFDIVKRTVADMVPKAIVLYLVAYAKENLQRELLSGLYKSEEIIDLLRESDQVIQRRLECQRMVLALRRAEDIVSSI